MRQQLARLMSVCLILTSVGLAQESQESVKPPLDIGEQVLNPGSSKYPAELAATGAQGSVIVKAKIGPEGRLVESQVVTSSKSKELDELATAYVNNLRIKSLADTKGAEEVIVQVKFARDTIHTILTKTCAEFNTDLAFARGLDPAASPKDLYEYNLGLGLVMFTPDRSSDELKVLARNIKTVPAAIETACAAQPDAIFAKELNRAITAR